MPARMPARKRDLLAAAITAAACLTTQALALTTAAPATAADEVVSRGVTIPEFYNPPTTLPAADGTLVRSEPLPSP